jgi:RNA polymerase sigma-70 factor (ECF subfamily)
MKETEFQSILQKTGKKIYNYLLKILRNKEDAEDIYQEVFISFYKKADGINPEYYENYLYKTAYHKALNLIKKQKRHNEIPFDEIFQKTDSPDESNEQKNIAIKNAIRKLKPKEALLIELQFFQKKSYKEISKIMSLSESAVDSRLVRVKKKLRKIIMQDFKDIFVL